MGWQTSHSMCLVLLVSCVNSNFQFHLLRLTLKYVSNICTVFLVIISLLIIYLLSWVELLLIFLFLSSLSWCAEKWSLSRSGRCLFFLSIAPRGRSVNDSDDECDVDADALWRAAAAAAASGRQRIDQRTASSVSDGVVVVEQRRPAGLRRLPETHLRTIPAASARSLLARGLPQVLVLRLPPRRGRLHALHQGELTALPTRLPPVICA